MTDDNIRQRVQDALASTDGLDHAYITTGDDDSCVACGVTGSYGHSNEYRTGGFIEEAEKRGLYMVTVETLAAAIMADAGDIEEACILVEESGLASHALTLAGAIFKAVRHD